MFVTGVVAAPPVFICLYIVAFLSGREAEGPCVHPVVVGAVFVFDCFCGGVRVLYVEAAQILSNWCCSCG